MPQAFYSVMLPWLSICTKEKQWWMSSSFRSLCCCSVCFYSSFLHHFLSAFGSCSFTSRHLTGLLLDLLASAMASGSTHSIKCHVFLSENGLHRSAWDCELHPVSYFALHSNEASQVRSTLKFLLIKSLEGKTVQVPQTLSVVGHNWVVFIDDQRYLYDLHCPVWMWYRRTLPVKLSQDAEMYELM